MGENEVNGVLRKVIKRSSRRNNTSEKCVVVFHMRLLLRRTRIAEEQLAFLPAIQVVFESRNTTEFTAVISQ